MKKIRMALLGIAAVSGIGGAFALNHRPPLKGGTTYYSQKISATESVWRLNRPDNACQPSSLACTITSTSSNVTSLAPNTFPAQYTVVNDPGKSHAE